MKVATPFTLFLFLVIGLIQANAQSDCQQCITINEFQFIPDNGPNGDPDITGEFIELFNRCNTPVEIGCMQVCSMTGSYCGECVSIPAGTVLAAGDVYLMGGYGTNCSGSGVSTCDFPNVSLDLNWHNCGCVNDPDAGLSCSSANSGKFWGVLVDAGEDISLFGADNSLVDAVRYKGGGGYSSGDCGAGGTLNNAGCNGCSGSNVTLPNSSSLTDLTGNGNETGFVANCSGSYTALSGASQFNPGTAECTNLITPPCCSVNVAFTINDTSQCLTGNAFQFTSTGSNGNGVSYSWDFGDGNTGSGANATHTYADSGRYRIQLVVDSNNSCKDTTESQVIVGQTEASILPPDTVTCTTDSVTLNAGGTVSWPGGTSYTWSTSNGTIGTGGNTVEPTVKEQGNYIVIATDDSLQCADTASAFVPLDTVTPAVSLTTINSDSAICQGTPITIQANPVGYDNYTFYRNGSIVQDSASSTYTSSTLPLGTNQLTAIAAENGCTGPVSDTLTLLVDSLIQPEAGPDKSACIGAGLDTLTSGQPQDGTWSGIGVVDSAGIVNPSIAGVGTHQLIYSFTNNNGCEARDTLSYTVHSLPDADGGQDKTICKGDTTSLQANGGSAYQWEPAYGLANPSANPTQASPERDTTYSVIVTDTTGCRATDSVTISVRAEPTADFTLPDQQCVGNKVRFTNRSKPDTNLAYGWYFGDNSTSTDKDPLHTYDEEGNFNVTLKAGSGNCADTVTKSITIHPLPKSSFRVDTTRIVLANGASFEFKNQSSGANDQQWWFGDGQTSPSSNPTHIYQDTGKYNVSLAVANQYGCKDTLLKQNYIEVIRQSSFFVPNAFTPNGDGKNERFKVLGRAIKDIQLQIFNRWGEKVFESYDKKEGWDGTYKGKKMPAGVYTYIVKVQFYDRGSIMQKGSVTLLR